MFHPSWNVYTLKREIVKQLLDPILSSRESTRTTETDEEKKELEEDEDEEDVKLESEAQSNLPRPEILTLENKWFGHRLQNNREKLKEALAEIVDGIVSQDNENALLLASHPDIPVPDHAIKEQRIQNPYEDIDLELAPIDTSSAMQKIIDAAASLLNEYEQEQKGLPVVRIDPKLKELEDQEKEKKKKEEEEKKRKEQEEKDRIQREKEKRMLDAQSRAEEEKKRREAEEAARAKEREDEDKSRLAQKRATIESFIDTFAPPTELLFIVWVIVLIGLWIGHAYTIWAGWKLGSIDCNSPMGDWLVVAGVFNLANMCLFLILSLKAEWHKFSSNFEDGVGSIFKGIEWTLYLFLTFTIAWMCYGTALAAESNKGGCSLELYDTTVGYVITCWVLLVVQALWVTVRYFERINRIARRKKEQEQKDWDTYSKRSVKKITNKKADTTEKKEKKKKKKKKKKEEV